MIRLDPPGSPLQGWTITVPAGAYKDATEFRVTSWPITSHTFGEAFDPQTPLVKIDSGGAVSGAFLTLEVPLDLSEGSFPLGFTYDEASGELEGLPVHARGGTCPHTYEDVLRDHRRRSARGSAQRYDHHRLRSARDMWPFPNNGSAAAPADLAQASPLTFLLLRLPVQPGTAYGLRRIRQPPRANAQLRE